MSEKNPLEKTPAEKSPVVGKKTDEAVPDRLTVIEQVYHQTGDTDPWLSETRYSRELLGREEPYERQRLTATEEWTTLDLGWVECPGTIIIRNREGVNAPIPRSQEQKDALAAKILEVRLGDGGSWLLGPGEPLRGNPDDARRISVRSRSGRIVYSLCVICR